MPLDFGSFDVQFERAPLTRVICQVRFSPIYALLTESGVAGFQEAIRREYPSTSPEQSVDVVTSATGVSIDQHVPVWRFSDDQGWGVSMAVDFVALNTTSYVNFDDFAARLNRVLDAVDRTLQPSPSTRIGLRKINAITHPDATKPSDWASLVRPEVGGLLGAPSAQPNLEGSSGAAQLTDGADGTLLVRHGVWVDPDTPIEPSTFHLDLDYFTIRPYAIEGSTDLTALLQDYSNSITSFFAWSLERPLREYLGPESRQRRSHEGEHDS